ncbi:MAG: prevent-host-death family protein [Gammaproteobacteria bacterium RIFCSPHIGHO2_12_FULL_41_20]|nr:MAG: prevent-host-death family protein [Gammaproteobacteria bacterium RIFCSPHIGHO2_12_FULL_41_20]
MTTTISTVDAAETFSDLINRVAHNKERILLTRRGKEIAAIVPLDDFHLLQELQNKRDLQEAIEALKEARHAGTLSLEQLKEEVGS